MSATELEEFEKMGKTILKHKYLYYTKCYPIIGDYEYDIMERDYVVLAHKLDVKPEVSLIADWSDGEGIGTVIDFPTDHPWAKEIIEKHGE